MQSSFTQVLLSDGPAPDRAAKLELYGFLVGRWEFEATVHLDNGSVHEGRGEIHAVWVLEGRAIQDVWILPGVFYGSTLRVYDPRIDGWHILWSDPLRQYYTRQVGRRLGSDIVQEGTDQSGTPVRWSFTDRGADSFRWIGERGGGADREWKLQAEFLARRIRC